MNNVDQEDWKRTDLLKGLEESGNLSASMDGGCWDISKNSSGMFDGKLMQYGTCTDKFTNASLDKALDIAENWATCCSPYYD